MCGCREFTSLEHKISQGYWPLLNLLYRTLAGETAWAQGKCLTTEVAILMSEREGRDLLQLTLDDWGVESADDLGAVLGFSLTEPFMLPRGSSRHYIPWQLYAAMIASSRMEVESIKPFRRSKSST